MVVNPQGVQKDVPSRVRLGTCSVAASVVIISYRAVTVGAFAAVGLLWRGRRIFLTGWQIPHPGMWVADASSMPRRARCRGDPQAWQLEPPCSVAAIAAVSALAPAKMARSILSTHFSRLRWAHPPPCAACAGSEKYGLQRILILIHPVLERLLRSRPGRRRPALLWR